MNFKPIWFFWHFFGSSELPKIIIVFLNHQIRFNDFKNWTGDCIFILIKLAAKFQLILNPSSKFMASRVRKNPGFWSKNPDPLRF